jgi:tetratricopeptide (TPR) repeat protein
MVKPVYAAIIVLILFSVPALRSDEFAKGGIVPEVQCREDATQTYVLFLPSTYNAEKKWPVVYSFDVAGHGKVPAELLKKAAEKYGYIIVGANILCKGPWEPIKTSFETLRKDTDQRLAIDPKRVYMAGFDAGARVASRLGAERQKPAAGILACGAAFAAGQNITQGVPYIYFSAVAAESARLKEMQRVHLALKSIRVPSRQRVHEGKHGWPSAELMTEAVEWFEIQAIQIGIKAEDWALIDTLFEKRLQRARKHEAAGELFEAYTRYRELVLDFKGLLETNAVAERTIALRDTRTVTDELARRAEQQQHDERIREKVKEKVLAVRKAVARKDAKMLDQLIQKLRTEAAQKDDEKMREVAMATFQQFLLFYDEGFNLLVSERYEEAIIHLELARTAAPRHPEINYNLACAYALNKNKGPALKYLQQAVECGYDKIEHIEEDEDFDIIREEEGYREIILKMKADAKTEPPTE